MDAACLVCDCLLHPGYTLRRRSGSVSSDQHVPVRRLPLGVPSSWHLKYLAGTPEQQADAVGVTITSPYSDGSLGHLGGIYSTGPASSEPRGSTRADLLQILGMLGMVAHRHGVQHSPGQLVEGLSDVVDVALSDQTLMHECFRAFITGKVILTADHHLQMPDRDLLLYSYPMQRELYGVWACTEISRKLHNVYRTAGLAGLVTSLLQNPGEDRALGALMKMGLACSYAAATAAQRRRLAGVDSGIFEGGFPTLPPDVYPYMMLDNMGLNAKPVYIHVDKYIYK